MVGATCNRRVTYDDGAGQLGVEDGRRRKATSVAVSAAEGLRWELPNLQLEDALQLVHLYCEWGHRSTRGGAAVLGVAFE